jgi:hypothetical protein
VTIICVLSILFNIIIVNLNQRNYKIHGSLPKWIKKLICHNLARLLRMKPTKPSSNNIENMLVLIEKTKSNRQIINESEELNELIKEMKDLHYSKLNDDLNLDSRFAAAVLDRFFLIFFILLTLISTIFIFTL